LICHNLEQILVSMQGRHQAMQALTLYPMVFDFEQKTGTSHRPGCAEDGARSDLVMAFSNTFLMQKIIFDR